MDRLIINYLPDILKEVKEIKAITDIEQDEIKELWDSFKGTMNEQFINTSTEYGISRWENILKITPKGTETLQVRKLRILTRLSTQLPYTCEKLKQQLDAICGSTGYKMTLESDIYTLTVRVMLTGKYAFNSVDNLLKNVCPANLFIDLSLLYNQHSTLAAFTHAKLSNYTYEQIRSEVIN